MNIETATAYLSDPDKKPSEVGAAVDALYREYGTYDAITENLVAGARKRASGYWIARHRVYQLPKGIQWQVDEEHINIVPGLRAFQTQM